MNRNSFTPKALNNTAQGRRCGAPWVWLPVLKKLMVQRNSKLRLTAAGAVHQITGDKAEVASFYRELLKHPGVTGWYGRYRAACFFREYAADFKDMEPAMLQIVRKSGKTDAELELVTVAAGAIWHMSKNKEAVPALLK